MAYALIWFFGAMVSFGYIAYIDMNSTGGRELSVDDMIPMAGVAAMWPLILGVVIASLPLAIPYFIAKTLVNRKNKPKD